MEILLMLAGAIIGALVSWSIANRFHKKASAEFQIQINEISKLNQDMAKTVSELIEISHTTAEMAEKIEAHVVAGTPDDPEFPYK